MTRDSKRSFSKRLLACTQTRAHMLHVFRDGSNETKSTNNKRGSSKKSSNTMSNICNITKTFNQNSNNTNLNKNNNTCARSAPRTRRINRTDHADSMPRHSDAITSRKTCDARPSRTCSEVDAFSMTIFFLPTNNRSPLESTSSPTTMQDRWGHPRPWSARWNSQYTTPNTCVNWSARPACMTRLPAQQTNPSHPQNQTNKDKFTVNNCRVVYCGVCICERNVKQEQDVLSTNDGSSSTQVVVNQTEMQSKWQQQGNLKVMFKCAH